MMYGTPKRPEHWVRHILLLRGIQEETAGFTEFVPLGFIHSKTSLFHRADAPARDDPGDENLTVHALARIF